jgi:hypothetical protein
LSPMLFALYVNDLEEYLIDKGCKPVEFGSNELNHILKLIVLMYADDTILISDTPHGLQQSLNCLRDYCKVWKLQVNESKTKVVIFSVKVKARMCKRFIMMVRSSNRWITLSTWGRWG